MSRATPAAVLLGALGGVSIWVSLGAVAVLDREALERVAALPPWWALGVLAGAGAAVAWAGRFRAADLLPLGVTGLLWLPYLPVPIPVAFLLWTGPIVWGVWIVAIAGVLAARWPRVPEAVAAWSRHARAPVAASVAAMAVYLAIAAAVAPRIPTGDEPHYLVMTQSLLADGDLRIENNHQRGDYLAYYGGGQLRPHYLRRGVDGEIYSVHLPGVSVLALPAFVVAGYAGVMVLLALLMAAAGWLGWQAAWRLTGDRGPAWLAWAAVMLSTPIAFHAFTVYPDGPGAVIVAGALLALVRLDRDGASSMPPRALAGLGAALACLPWLHTRFSLLAGAFGLVVLLRLWPAPDRRARAAALLAVPFVMAVAWFGYFWTIYGTPNPAAPYGGYTQTALRNAFTGVPGLLVDQQFGLLAYAPIYVAALAGFVPLARARPRLALECAAILAPYWLVVGSYAMWWGGFSAPARFLVASLPVLMLPAAAAWHAWRGRAARTWMGAALALSCLVVVVVAGVNRGALLYERRTGYAELLDWVNQTVNMPLALPAVHRGAVGTAVASAAIWLACLALATAVLSVASRRRQWAPGEWWLAGGLAVAAGVMAALTLGWRLEGTVGATRATSQMALLSAWDPWRLEVGVELPSLRWMDADDLPEELRLSTTLREVIRAGDAPLLVIPRVPAGEYDLVTGAGGALTGEITVRVGRDEHVIDRWPLDGRFGPDPGLSLTLPVEVHSVIVRGDDRAVASLGGVYLRPRGVPGASRRDYAPRATRVGRARAFFLDENAFVEEHGFWTRGEAATTVVLVPDGGARPALRLQAGPVPAPVELRVGAWRWRSVIAPRASEVVTLPSVTAGDAVRVMVRTDAGFLPYEHDRESGDDRHLGVWVSAP